MSRHHGNRGSPRSSRNQSDTPRLLNPSPYERNWIRTIPDSYPDILRAPAVNYKAERDDSRIKINKYVAFSRPYRGKQGLLIIGRDKRPIIVDETNSDQPQVLPMRLDREALTGTWIFAISIYTAEGLIQLEDCIVADDEQVRSSKPFSQRFTILQRFAESIWYQDKQFQLNWQIQVAEMHPLLNIRDAMAALSGGNLCMMPDLSTFRLLKVIPLAPATAPVIVGAPNEFICIAVEGKPDVYDLRHYNGTDAGRASIQTLSISQALQHLSSEGKPLRVLAVWNEDFESYVVTSVLSQ